MEDFIFGTLATDQLKLIHHRILNSGVQHAYRIYPQDPSPGQPITFEVKIGPNVDIDHAACYYTLDGSEPKGSRGTASAGEVFYFKKENIYWDTLLWGYLSHWKAALPPQAEGTTVRYIISAWKEDGEEIFADWPDVKMTIEHLANYYFKGKKVPEIAPLGDPKKATQFKFKVDRHSPPGWLRKGVIYHIFVDRFFPGQNKDWLQTMDLQKPFGGTLWGIAEKLDYIEQLGATAIWLSPIFPSPTIHRYNATDYYHVAEELGGDQALRTLIDKAHQKGIKIILDLVCNHVSDQHPYFQSAIAETKSKHRDWFYFDDHEKTGYRTFFGVPTMPQVNLDNPQARAWMLDVGRFWLEEYNIDGYRLDHATGPGPNFWIDFWEQCKSINPNSICIGEVVEPPEIQYSYAGRMDGLLDFHLCEAFRKSIGTQKWSYERFENFYNQHIDYFGDDILMASFLDNHDMDRFLFIAGNKVEKLKTAAELQFQMPGPPIIYYGTEVGLKQTVSKTTSVGLEASRGAMVWGGEQDEELFNFYQDLVRGRKSSRPWEFRK